MRSQRRAAERSLCGELLDDRVRDLLGLCGPSLAGVVKQVRGKVLALGEDAVDGAVDARGRVGVAEVREHEGGRPNGRDRVGLGLTLDVGGGTVDGLSEDE